MELNEIEKENNEFTTSNAITSEDAAVDNSTFIGKNDNVKEKNDCTNEVEETFVLEIPHN